MSSPESQAADAVRNNTNPKSAERLTPINRQSCCKYTNSTTKKKRVTFFFRFPLSYIE